MKTRGISIVVLVIGVVLGIWLAAFLYSRSRWPAQEKVDYNIVGISELPDSAVEKLLKDYLLKNKRIVIEQYGRESPDEPVKLLRTINIQDHETRQQLSELLQVERAYVGGPNPVYGTDRFLYISIPEHNLQLFCMSSMISINGPKSCLVINMPRKLYQFIIEKYNIKLY